MGYAEFQCEVVNTTVESFRAWVKAFLDGWEAAGWVRASDTGQINPTTVALPAASTPGGYAMYRLDDDAQTTSPVFWKVEFGSGGTLGYARGQIWLTVGRSTDGAGNITGIPLLTRRTIGVVGNGNYAGVVTGGEATNLASAGPGYVAFLPHALTASTSGSEHNLKAQSFIIERSRDVDGTPMADGLMIAVDRTSSTVERNLTSAGHRPHVFAINYADGSYTESIPPVSIPYRINGTVLGPGTSLAAGSIGPVFPWVLIAPGLAPWQSCVILCVPAGDYPAGVFETTLCGNRATFRAVPASVSHMWGQSSEPGGVNVSGYIGPAIRWEP